MSKRLRNAVRFLLITSACVLAAVPAAAQCNPSYDAQCGIISGDGPNVGFSPAGASYSLEVSSKTVPISIVFTDEDGVNGSTLQVRLWRAGSPVAVPLSWSTTADGVRGTATGNLELTAYGEYVLVAQIADKLGTIGSDRVNFSLTQADAQSAVVSYNFHHNGYRDTSIGAMTVVYPGWSYLSMNTPRTTALMYSSELGRPTSFIQMEAYPRATSSPATVMSMRVEYYNDGAAGPQPLRIPEVFYKAASAPQQRVGAVWRWTPGTYTGTISKAWGVVRTYRSGINDFSDTRFPVRFLILNEANSRYGAGWIVAGIKRLYEAGTDGALIHEGDGRLLFFERSCPTPTTCSYLTPDGDFSKLVKTPAGTWLRTDPDGGQVVFSAAGLMTSATDSFGDTTTVEWQIAQDGTNTPVLSRIVDPLGLATTFAYDASWYLKSITTPGGRTVNVTLNSAKQITELAGPTTMRLTYTDRLLTSYNVSSGGTDPGATTDITYDRDLKMKTVTGPGVTLHNGLQARPKVAYRQLAEIVVPDRFWIPEEHNFGLPANAVISADVFAETTDPEGHVSKVASDRYGNPTKVIDALGNVTTAEWSLDGLPERISGPTEWTTNVWDGNGNLLSSIVNGAAVYIASYDLSGRPEFELKGKEASWYEYGSRGQVLRTWYGKITDYNRTATRYEYNSRYQLTASIDPKGLRTEWSYENNPWKNVDVVRVYRADGTIWTTSFTYDDKSRPRTVTNSLGESMTTDYDAFDRPVRVVDGLGRATSYHYTGPHLTSVTDGGGKAYGFTYNALGWLEAETFPDGGSRTYKYDRDGLPRSTTDRRGLVTTGTYDAIHRVLTRGADGATTTFGYPDHHTTVVTNGESVVTTKTVPGTGRLDSIVSTLGPRQYEIKHVYDSLDALRHLGFDLKTWNGASLVRTNSMRLGVEFQPTDVTLGVTYSLTDLGGRTTSMHIDTAGRPIRTILPNGITQSHSIHNDGRLAALTFSAPAVNQKLGATFAWDFLDRLNTRTTIAEDKYWNYAYDAGGQVTRYGGYTNPPETCTGINCRVTVIREELYTYDTSGNRSDRGAVFTAGTNRVIQFGGFTLEYDLDGNVTRKYKAGHDQRFTWNALGQLTGVTTNGATVSYGYDGLGRRVRRTENGQSRYFLYDGDDLLLESDANGEPLRLYTHWPGVDNPHSVRMANGTTYYYVTERPGHVTGLLNEAGAVAAEYRYTAWGEIESSSDPTGQPLRFMSRELDAATGLYYVRARWYDQAMGRFVSQDPIGLGGGMNPYEYADNDPVNQRDPSGLTPCMWWISFSDQQWKNLHNRQQTVEDLREMGVCIDVTVQEPRIVPSETPVDTSEFGKYDWIMYRTMQKTRAIPGAALEVLGASVVAGAVIGGGAAVPTITVIGRGSVVTRLRGIPRVNVANIKNWDALSHDQKKAALTKFVTDAIRRGHTIVRVRGNFWTRFEEHVVRSLRHHSIRLRF
jgi:RHS repeat-associated protein